MRLQELAKPFQDERELAFFVVRVGMSVSEYRSLTEAEKMFIRKEYESNFIYQMTWFRNAVQNAEYNVNRGKNKKYKDLFPRKPQKADKEYNENAIKTILEMEKEKGKGWVALIYKRNGMKTPKKGG